MTGREAERAHLLVDGRDLRVSSLDKVMWPRAGFTKRQMIDFYLAVAPALLPHVRGRPVTTKRAPYGVDGHWWFQTECPRPPHWMPPAPVQGARPGKVWNYCAVAEAASLAWLANLGCIEVHPLLFQTRDPHRPVEVVFDLDPGVGAGIARCCRVAMLLRDELERLSLAAFVKTSGLAGLHVHVPLAGDGTFGRTTAFARALARRLTLRRPDDVADRRGSSARSGRVLIDWAQNRRYASVVAPYSLRVASYPLVATPIAWDEVEAAERDGDERRLVFVAPRVVDRLAGGIDPFVDMRRMARPLPVIDER